MKKRKRISKNSAPTPLRVNLQMLWKWAHYASESCNQCGAPVGDGALAELYMPLHPPTPYRSEAEEFQAADDACNALADQQEQDHFALYGMQLYCGACAEKAITEDVGTIAQAVISDLRSNNLTQFWVATLLQYEPGAYGKYQPFFIHGIGPASIPLIYSRACRSAKRGINDEPRVELDYVRVSKQPTTRGAEGPHWRRSRPTGPFRAKPRQTQKAQSRTRLDIDEQGRAHLRTEPSQQPCEECGRPGPNKKWTVIGNSGVLCTRCLSLWIEEVNTSLGAKDVAPTEKIGRASWRGRV